MDHDDRVPDDPMTHALRRLARRADPPPDHLMAGARDALAFRDLDAAFAELVADSAVDEPVGLVRGPATARLLSFAAGEGAIEVEVTEVPGGLRVFGHLLPPPPPGTRVELRRPGGAADAACDAEGRFGAAPVPPGPVSLRIVPGDGGPAVVTEWLAI